MKSRHSLFVRPWYIPVSEWAYVCMKYGLNIRKVCPGKVYLHEHQFHTVKTGVYRGTCIHTYFSDPKHRLWVQCVPKINVLSKKVKISNIFQRLFQFLLLKILQNPKYMSRCDPNAYIVKLKAAKLIDFNAKNYIFIFIKLVKILMVFTRYIRH